MKLTLAVVYAVALGIAWGTWFTRPTEQPALWQQIPPTCYSVNPYTIDTNPIKFCAPQEMQTN